MSDEYEGVESEEGLRSMLGLSWALKMIIAAIIIVGACVFFFRW